MAQPLPNNATPIILATPGKEVVQVGSRTVGGQPVKRFKKELAKAGHFVTGHGVEFNATPELFDHFAAQFSRWTEAGNKVALPLGHTIEPDKNRGWLTDCFREGESLWGVVELIGEDAISLAGRVDVSIYAEPEARDGVGNTYPWAITHVALCTDPVVPGLSGFIPLAASKSTPPVNVPVFVHKGPISMADPAAPAPAPTPDTATGANPSEAIVQAITDKVVALIKDTGKTPQEKKAAFGDLMKRLEKALGVFGDDEPAKPEGEAPAPAEPVAASRKPDPMLLELAGENRRAALNGLVRDGKITPAVAAKLAAQHAEGDGLALSLTPHGIASFKSLVAALGENDPVALGQQTRGQVVSLSRSTPTGQDDADALQRRKEAGKELRDMTARAAGMKPAA